MQEQARLARNNERLTECFPTFAARLAVVIQDMEAQGFRPRIQDAHRSPEDQAAAVAAGHSTVSFSFHNVTGANGNPEALAVDMLDDDHPVGDVPREYLITLASIAQKHGLRSGIFFFKTEPPSGTREALKAAVDSLNFDPNIKIGFDPTHLETTGVTIAQAKTSQRPA